jgi:hypothetical protein
MEAPGKFELKGRMAIQRNPDGSETYHFMTGGIWRKLQPGSQTRDSRFREATKEELAAWNQTKNPRRNLPPTPELVEFEDEPVVPEDSPVTLDPTDAPVLEEEEELGEGELFEQSLTKIRTFNQMEEFLILELDFNDEMDRTGGLAELKKMAREMKIKKDAGME